MENRVTHIYPTSRTFIIFLEKFTEYIFINLTNASRVETKIKNNKFTF